MNVATMLSRYGRASREFAEIVRMGGFTTEAHHETGEPVIRCSPERMTPLSRKIALSAPRIVDRIEILMIGKMLVDGPKIFRPKRIDMEALEQMSVNVELEDYAQPYEIMAIELPDRYLATKRIHCPQAGQWVYQELQPEQHEPCTVFLQVLPELRALWIMVTFSSSLSVKTSFVIREGKTIEQVLESYEMKDQFKNCLDMSDDELRVVKEVSRACLNYCLLIEELGSRRVGPNNPAHYERLRRRCEHGRFPEEAREEFAAHPIIYELDQRVTLYRTVRSDSDLPSEPTGAVMPPHHRRGYWRMQPCGPKWSERKRIRIPPTFVNKHLFAGTTSTATYTT